MSLSEQLNLGHESSQDTTERLFCVALINNCPIEYIPKVLQNYQDLRSQLHEELVGRNP
jgi:hypothetical protein